MKENNKLKVVHTTWEEFLKEHPVNEVVDTSVRDNELYLKAL